MAADSIMLVAGEASGDMHGARLLAAIKALLPQVRFCGIGGPALKEAGMEVLYDSSRLAVVGVVEIIGHFRFIREAMAALEARIKEDPPRLLILIDYPDFNLRLAKKAKAAGIPIFYYISPQVWAWRSGRVQTIRRLVDRLAVILPFEQEFYRRKGMEVDFVGHPLLDALDSDSAQALARSFCKEQGIAPESTLIGILPGSRKREVASMLPTFLAAARRIARKVKNPVFLLPLAPTLDKAVLSENGLADCGLDIRVISENRYGLMAACRAVIAASGTVTLELAILDVPMVVAYRVAPLTYLLGRLLVRVHHASLVNLVAGREVVPELLQNAATPEAIAALTLGLLPEGEKRKALLAGLADVRLCLGGPGASMRAARLALELLV